jgi:polyhydroxyalkanoate synthesis repressor PhaR
MLLVKKYGNRRLYDTQASSYITMTELASRIRGGADVRVIDAKSNEDLTQATLTQIIVEDRGLGRLLPVPLLTELIRMGDGPLAEFLGRYVGWALEVFVQTRQGFAGWAGHSFGGSPFGGLMPFGPLWPGQGRLQQLFGPAAQPPAHPQNMQPSPHLPSEVGTSAAAPAALSEVPSNRADDLADLRRELELLKRSVRKGRA